MCCHHSCDLRQKMNSDGSLLVSLTEKAMVWELHELETGIYSVLLKVWSADEANY